MLYSTANLFSSADIWEAATRQSNQEGHISGFCQNSLPITTWCDSKSGLEALSFSHDASVIQIKVDFLGLASVIFIFGDTKRLRSADYCQGCRWPLATGSGALHPRLIWRSRSCFFTSARQIFLRVNNRREPSYISSFWTASPITLRWNRLLESLGSWFGCCIKKKKKIKVYSTLLSLKFHIIAV